MGAPGPPCRAAEQGWERSGRRASNRRHVRARVSGARGFKGWVIRGADGKVGLLVFLDLGSVSSSLPALPLLRGTFYQGYLCTKCGVGAHKECLEVTPPCKISEYRPLPRRSAQASRAAPGGTVTRSELRGPWLTAALVLPFWPGRLRTFSFPTTETPWCRDPMRKPGLREGRTPASGHTAPRGPASGGIPCQSAPSSLGGSHASLCLFAPLPHSGFKLAEPAPHNGCRTFLIIAWWFLIPEKHWL